LEEEKKEKDEEFREVRQKKWQEKRPKKGLIM
jgi:hypothetical protein